MKKVLNFVKGKKDDKGPSKINPQISVEITNPSGQKITSDDEHIVGLQQGFGYSVDLNGKDKALSKIHKASWTGNLEKVKVLAKKSDINVADAHSRTCLHLAVSQGHTEVAWFLLNNNASTTACDNEGLTPFLKAVECGQKDCTNLLIECGVDVNVTDSDGNTGLHIAARSGFFNIASLLLKEGANLNVPNNSGNYPLHMATSCDHRDIVELLLKFGANVQVLDREKRTPLMLAARNGLNSIIKVLLESGAALDTADSNGWTAEDYAQFGGHHDLMELLETKKKEVSIDQSDKLSVQSSDQSELVNFEPPKSTGQGNEETTDSPRSCVIPPALEPPRSWDLIQSGVMDQEGSLETRKSLLTLSNLKKGYEGGSCELIVSPADNAPASLSPSGDIPAEMRLSPEPLSLAPTPERRTRSPLERAPSVDLPSDNDSPLQGFSTDEVTGALKQSQDSLNDNNNVPPRAEFSKINNNISGKFNMNNTETSINRFNEKNVLNDFQNLPKNEGRSFDSNLAANDNTYSMECSVSYDDLDDRSYFTENQVSSSLDNIDYDNGKSLSIEIVQSTGNLDDTLSITTTKNIFRECHSLELLEAQVGDTRSYKNSKRHHRNKSITLTGQPQLWKSVSTLPKTHSFDRGSIDAQLLCYDEALRQLANVKKPAEAKDAQSNTSPEPADFKPSGAELPGHKDSNDIQCSSLEEFPAPSADFPAPTDDDLEYLDRDISFPPPPIHFLRNEDDLCQMDCDDKGLHMDVLPMPISMLTPIKETQVECDSLSVAETYDNEHSLSERSNLKSDGTPNHFNVEVIVNSKTPEPSQSFDETLPPTVEPNEASLQLIDDVFIDDPTLAEQYDKYFVDLKALEMVPSAVDFSKIVFPSDSPSPKKSVRKGCNDKATTMRATGVGGSKDTDRDIEENATDDDGDSDEDDPPFWQNNEKGGFFIRQDTIVSKASDPRSSSRLDIEATTSTARRSCGSPLQNSEAETASASDTPKLSPMGIREPSHSHLCSATLANGLLEEQAVALMNNTARLKYELEDARQNEAVRSDTISILQSQLSRLEAQYAGAQEEVCTLKQKADCAELELKHLREMCACLSRERKERTQDPVKQLVDQATASTPTEDDYRQIHMQIMIKHLEDSKKLEEEKNHHLVRHLEEVLKTNQNMISEKEALIAQNIADVRKLQEDTLCWKDRYEELAAKLELLDKRLDPRLIEAQDTIATLKRTIAILQQEKFHSKRDASNHHCTSGLEWINDLIAEIEATFRETRNIEVFKVSPDIPGTSESSCDCECNSPRTVSLEEIVSPAYPSSVSEKVVTSSSDDPNPGHSLAESEVKSSRSACTCDKSKSRSARSNQRVVVTTLKTTVDEDSGKVDVEVTVEDECDGERLTKELRKKSSGHSAKGVSNVALNSCEVRSRSTDSNHRMTKLSTPKAISRESPVRLSEADLLYLTQSNERSPGIIASASSGSSCEKKKNGLQKSVSRGSGVQKTKSADSRGRGKSSEMVNNRDVNVPNVLSPSELGNVGQGQSALAKSPSNTSRNSKKFHDSSFQSQSIEPDKSKLDSSESGHPSQNLEESGASNLASIEKKGPDSRVEELNQGNPEGTVVIASGSRYSIVANSDYPPRLFLLSTHNVGDDGMQRIVEITGSSILTNDKELTESFMKKAPEIAQKMLIEKDAEELKNGKSLPSSSHHLAKSPSSTSRNSKKFRDASPQVSKVQSSGNNEELLESSSFIQKDQQSGKQDSGGGPTSSKPGKTASGQSPTSKSSADVRSSGNEGPQESSSPIQKSKNSGKEDNGGGPTSSKPGKTASGQSTTSKSSTEIQSSGNTEGLQESSLPVQQNESSTKQDSNGRSASCKPRKIVSGVSAASKSSTSKAVVVLSDPEKISPEGTVAPSGKLDSSSKKTDGMVQQDAADKACKLSSDFAGEPESKTNVPKSSNQTAASTSRSAESNDNPIESSSHGQKVKPDRRGSHASDSSKEPLVNGLNVVPTSLLEAKILSDWDAMPSDQNSICSQKSQKRLSTDFMDKQHALSAKSVLSNHPELMVLVDWNVVTSDDAILSRSPRGSGVSNGNISQAVTCEAQEKGNDQSEDKQSNANLPLAATCAEGYLQSQSESSSGGALLAKADEENCPPPMIVLWTPNSGHQGEVSPNRSLGHFNPEDLASIRESFQFKQNENTSIKKVESSETVVNGNVPKHVSSDRILSNALEEHDESHNPGFPFSSVCIENVIQPDQQYSDSKRLSNSAPSQTALDTKNQDTRPPDLKTDQLRVPSGERIPPRKREGAIRVKMPSPSNDCGTTGSLSHTPHDHRCSKTELSNLNEESEPILCTSSECSSSRIIVQGYTSSGSRTSVTGKSIQSQLDLQNGRISSSPEKQNVSFAKGLTLKKEFSPASSKNSIKSVLPPIKEEPELPDDAPPESFYKTSIMSKASESSVGTCDSIFDDESDGTRQSVTPSNHCQCRTICTCCTCGQQGSPIRSQGSRTRSQGSLRRSHGTPKRSHDDRRMSRFQPPSAPELVKKRKRPPRENPIDMSSPPFPRSSQEVLSSPFFAHWSYYDIDSDHPLTKYMKRWDTTASDGNDCIIVKGVRVGGYYLPFMSACMKKKVSAKMICNFYKSHLGRSKKVANKDMAVDRDGEVPPCDCSENNLEDSIWKYYVPPVVRNSVTMDVEENENVAALGHSTRCTRDSPLGCICMGERAGEMHAVPALLETSPCQSCDCFISDVASVSSTQSIVRTSDSTLLTEESLTDRSQIFNEYLAEMHELCTALNMLVGQMKAVMEEPSPSSPNFSYSVKKSSAFVDSDLSGLPEK